MHPIVFLALLAIVMLALAALRLELNFRRAGEQSRESEPRPQRPAPRPELRAAPAGGYCQAPFSPTA
jgi:hypothetical protein